ncbi:hypothetical protein HYFRA_00002817 [Hymenoscyphus fraxineus]|uniref:BTB domain-containing protein n=1 Tax=Hymenoscyphus fraxineus TaxID=746836 RepID=A0A9N9KPX2_9HELO|nr:hypothetical protein HYFRA_00002817 [Hymenoscyphus fraxineus]
MASRTSSVKRPTLSECLRMIDGPKVDIFVGPTRKHFSLPKLLLCHYSKFFDACLNGGFREAKEQKLDLPEDEVRYFEALLEVMLQGNTTPRFGSQYLDALKAMDASSAPKDATKSLKALKNECLELLQYADKYNLSEMASDMVYDSLYFIWISPHHVLDSLFAYHEPRLHPRHNRPSIGSLYLPPTGNPLIIQEEDIEIIYRIAPPNHRLRDLVIRAVISCSVDSEGNFNDKFQHQKEEVVGFARDLLDFIIKKNRNKVSFTVQASYDEAAGL